MRIPQPCNWPGFTNAERWLNSLRDLAASNSPLPGKGYRLNRTPSGWWLDIIRSSKPGVEYAGFEVYRTDALKVKVAAGRILLHGVIVEVAESSEITIPANSTAHRIWLSLASEFGTDATAIGGTINNGASGWSGYPAQPNTGAFRHWLLAEVASGSDSITDLGIKWTGDIPWPPPLGFWK